MIQRIQSIYLFIASFGFLGQFVTDFATSTKPIPYLMADQIYEVQDSPVLVAMAILGALIAIGAIFVYNNRPLQQKLSIFTIISAIFLPLIAFVLIYNEGTPKDGFTEIHDQAGLYIMAIPIVFGFLAYKSIGKDDKLVKSMDRLR
jgi:hypothetical protein